MHPDHVVDIFKAQKGRRIEVHKEVIKRDKMADIYVFRGTCDMGNVFYHNYLRAITDNRKMSDIFQFTKATSEKVGDVVEMWLGLCDVAKTWPMD